VRCDTAQADDLANYPIREAFAAAGVNFGYDSFPLSEPTLREGEATPIEPGSPVNPNIPLSDEDGDL
jgi:hypothetical protein